MAERRLRPLLERLGLSPRAPVVPVIRLSGVIGGAPGQPLRAPGLVLHEDNGRFSAAAEAVLRHAKPLPLCGRTGKEPHG